ncbi:uncharacterized protein LTR77_001838 [Saxophila tyrrhenica]|uniref:Major facilitator superfamily (MFS) profile domain-containing protein n=1 Tax=Saxophila tyrrhenica TaxID=1690608 RepID=A0AAV9PM66_9PEZI|nr:hypothetical protein LTR77_001838 [Saxophila tyrrhenica]
MEEKDVTHDIPRTDSHGHCEIDELKSVSSKDLDDTYEIYKRQDARDIDPQEAKRVLRKTDIHIMPLLMGTYMLQFLDKSSINFAAVFGLEEGTNLHGQDFSCSVTDFDFALNVDLLKGYLIAQYPAGYLLQRLPTGRLVGVTILIWGTLIITTPACNSFAGIATNRFLLGVFEAVVNPAFVLMMSMWYRSDEQPLRLVTYYCMNGFAGIFGGLLGFALGHISTGLQNWQYIFLVFGSISIAWAVIFLIFMPNLPSTARFFSAEQKVVAVERIATNRQGVKNHTFKWYQARQAALDPKTWILFVMAVAAQIPNAAQSQFTSIILATFGFTPLETQYYGMPGNAIQIVSLLLSGYISSHWPNMRCITMILGNLICVAAGAALVGLPNDRVWGRLVALWLGSCQSVGFAMSLTMVSSNIAGCTKKQILISSSSIIGPQTFIDNEAPSYPSAYIAILIGYSVKTVMVIILLLYMWMANKKRDRQAAAAGTLEAELEEKQAIESGMQDVTELDNRGFRYSL